MKNSLVSLLLFTLIFSSPLFARENFLVINESTPLTARNFALRLGHVTEEQEYEDGDTVLDQKDESALTLELTKGFIHTQKISTEWSIESEFFGKSKHRFHPTQNRQALPFDYSGIRALRARLIYQYEATQARVQGLIFEVHGSPGEVEMVALV